MSSKPSPWPLAAFALAPQSRSRLLAKPSAGAGVRFLVGFSQANLTEPWRIEMTEEVKAEAARYPDMRIIYTDAADSTSRQIRRCPSAHGLRHRPDDHLADRFP